MRSFQRPHPRAMDHPYRYDAFLSYRRQDPDRAFTRDLLRRLEEAGYTVAIDERDFEPNLPFLNEMERCIRESRFTLAVISPRYLQSGNCEEEAVISKVLDMGERKRCLLPLTLEKVQMPAWLYLLSGIDFAEKDPLVDPYEKLRKVLGPPLRSSASDRFQIHPRVGEIFAGRERELDDIEKSLLGEGRPVAICALQGMPGVGKSYLADRFYHLHTSRFPGGYQRLVLDPAGPDPTTDTLLGELADRLKITPDPAAVRGRLLQPRTLLHVENVDSAPLARATAVLVGRLPGCPIVVTGRYQGLGVDGGWGRVEVRPFNEKDALDQFAQELGDEVREGPESYRRLVRALGYLPLAIHLAAGHLRAGRTVGNFLERLRASGLTLEPDDPADPVLAARGREVLANTFGLSLDLFREHLARTGADADKHLAGFHSLAQAPVAGVGASLGAALADLPAAEFAELIFIAGKLSLLEAVPATDRPDRAWRLHPLVAELLRSRHGEEEARRTFNRMTQWFVERLPELPYGQEEEMGRRWKEVQAETEALTAWLARVPPDQRVKVEGAGSWQAINIGPFYAWGSFCEEMLIDSLTEAERSHVLWTLSCVSHRAGMLDRALAAAQEKAKLDRECGKERNAALALGVVADILRDRGQLDEALRIMREEEIPVFEKVGDIRSRTITLRKIADILKDRGQLDEALRIYREIIPVFEKIGDIQSRAVTLGQIADILQARGQLDEALRIRQEEEIPVYEKIGDIRSRAVTLGQIADILQARGQLDEALRIRQEEIPVYERIGDVHNLTIGRVELAVNYLKRDQEGDREAAKELLRLASPEAERMGLAETLEWIQRIRREYNLGDD
jgi:tetratricopeptide (TPR) repeat protein